MAMAWRKSIALLAFSLLSINARDIIVDDTDPSIVYSPADQWSQGASCETCTIHPDRSLAQDGTWHDSTNEPSQPTRSITFSFTGVEVKIFNILSGPVSSAPTTHVDLTFELDGETQTPFVYDPPDGSTFQYNALVFSAVNLDNKTHSLVIQGKTGVLSVILFDYIVYTVPDPPTVMPASPLLPPTSSSSLVPSASSSTTASSLVPSASSSSSSSTLASITSSSSLTATATTQATLLSSSLTHSSSSRTVPWPPLQQPQVNRTSDGPSIETESVLVTATQASDSTIPAGAVIGGAVGGAVLLLILLAAFLYVLCKRRARYLSVNDSFEPVEMEKPPADLHHEDMNTRHRPSLSRWGSTAPVLLETHTGTDIDDALPSSPSIIIIGRSHPHASVPHRSLSQSSVSAGRVTPPSSSHDSTSSGPYDTEKSIPSIGSEDHLLQTVAQRDVAEPPRDPSVRAHMTRLGLAELQEDFSELGEAPPQYDEASRR
ncbi:hypothetical protein BC628DRAFT_1355776 [Trametes gibbosa]|nr:hypothetical protein BC628DRAFT_1355776 [Trametes gibbosa]